MNVLKTGRKASKKIGGYVTDYTGLISYSIIGATLRINCSNKAWLSILDILLISTE